MKAIIFGITGQDGYYLQQILKTCNVDVIGISRQNNKWIIGDVANADFVSKKISEVKPHYIFHLAADSTTAHEALWENHKAISSGTLNILEAARLHCPAAKVFLSGSAAQFQNNGEPINEQSDFAASSTYAISRIHSVYAARYYRKAFGLKVYVGYFFNHDSVLRTERHVNQKIVNAVNRIKQDDTQKLDIGDISVKKEFNFAGDIMEAVWILVNQENIFEAVIGSGKSYSIKDWIEICFKKINKDWRDYTIIKEGFKSQYKILVSDPSLIMSIGWYPKMNIEQLAYSMFEEKINARLNQ